MCHIVKMKVKAIMGLLMCNRPQVCFLEAEAKLGPPPPPPPHLKKKEAGSEFFSTLQ